MTKDKQEVGRIFRAGTFDLDKDILVVVEGKTPTYEEFHIVYLEIRESSAYFNLGAPYKAANKVVELFAKMGHDTRHFKGELASRLYLANIASSN
jgi:hypothetical protein